MTEEAQRIAIAEACGWTMNPNSFYPNYGHNGTICSDGAPDWVVIPDYLHSLDAMHEAEKVLTNSQRRYYADMLVKVHPLHYDPRVANDLRPDQEMDLFLIAHMTAAQRAEAFLKTTGRWRFTP